MLEHNIKARASKLRLSISPPFENAKKIICKYGIRNPDTIVFLLGLKPVLRTTSADRGLIEKEGLAMVKDEKHYFISKKQEWGMFARELTALDPDKLSQRENSICNYVLGKLYGYPSCCARAFPKTNPAEEDKKKLKMYVDSVFLNARLYLPFYPCLKNCPNALQFKKEVEKRLKQSGLN